LCGADAARGSIDSVSIKVVGIGGSVDAGSQSDRVLRSVLTAVEKLGAEVSVYSGFDLDLPPYHSGAVVPDSVAEYIAAVRQADAVVITSPGYHGTISGLVKNALDYLEELRGDDRPYLDGRAVGLVAVARGWQASVSTLATLRQVVHALRGWPTPLGLAINSSATTFDESGYTADDSVAGSITVLARQLVDFAENWSLQDRDRSGR
jgi:FMN reductase